MKFGAEKKGQTIWPTKTQSLAASPRTCFSSVFFIQADGGREGSRHEFAAAAAMLQLYKLLLPVRRPASPFHDFLHRSLLLSTAAVGASPVCFAAEDYLVTTCGLTRSQAAEVAKHISHHKSPSNTNAVLSFLADPALGLSKADIAHLVSQDARILNCSVEKTLRPRVDAFSRHGFTAAQIRTFLRQAPFLFRRVNIDAKLGFWVPFLGSREMFLRVAKHGMYLLTADINRVVKVNIQLLRESGLSDADIAKLCVNKWHLLCRKPDRIRDLLTLTRELGVPCSSLMFKHVLVGLSSSTEETMPAKLKFIGQILGCSDAEVVKAVKTCPRLLSFSREKLHRVSEYVTKVLGIQHNSRTFRDAVASVACISPKTMEAKLKSMCQIFECSDDEVVKAVKTYPRLLSHSTEKIHLVSEYLTKVVGVDRKYILGWPTIMSYSLERRIAPRHYVMKVLMEKKLMRKEQRFFSLVTITDKKFRSKYIIPHEDILPGLADAYASACKGKLPPT